ncbi:MAG TPA: hypothetical protein GX503_08155 [Clostridiales bacterium]|nr:hypothetical protein [Clostridiales bacterium]
MKRKLMVILFLFALVFALTACTASQPDTGKANETETQDPNGAAIHDQDKEKAEDKNTDKGTQHSVPDDKGDTPQTDTEEAIKSIIEKRAMDVLTAIKNYDMEKLADAVHPDKGVRFSPYGYVDVANDLVFTAEQVKNLASDSKTYLWGHYDGSGEPIQLKFSDYYKKFIYDADFINAEQVGYNKILGHGNSLNNSFEVYKNSIIVEYYFSGFDPQYEGIDWRSLRLVFEKKNNTWYLVGIIHDQWTV